ncbi:ergothioneine biosynthesis protein EgtB [Alteribacter natronophilus]|nr:ergothioneine biosynthesis protein EgtB [Alteribacter natronophilus]
MQSEQLVRDYLYVRDLTMRITEPLETEDYVVQSMEDVSPPKWHMAHTTWFFEDFILNKYVDGYEYRFEATRKLFNSYYETLGKPFPRHQRGLLSRPTVREIIQYREEVDREMAAFLKDPANLTEEVLSLLEIGLQHEQQHQELLLTDIKYNFSINPLHPVFNTKPLSPVETYAPPMEWQRFEGGVAAVGTNDEHFSFDNERPEHKVYLYPFSIASRPVTNGEYMAFIKEGGYSNPKYWLSDGWAAVNKEGWEAPLYWEQTGGEWFYFTLNGFKKVEPEEPVTHISFYEADAYARWAGCRLPSEHEWETAFKDRPVKGQFLEAMDFHPAFDGDQSPYGSVWEWTRSPYTPYPENARPEGALGEYNAKFMSNQMVLRGGSCATPDNHVRPTYRNFFHPDKRWQFSGIRLAKDETGYDQD